MLRCYCYTKHNIVFKYKTSRLEKVTNIYEAKIKMILILSWFRQLARLLYCIVTFIPRFGFKRISYAIY